MNSYDIFDTIVGRICFKGTEIFEIMEKITKIKDFKQKRISCERKTLEETYTLLGLNDDVKNLELTLEYDFSFPIHKYLNEIAKDDILVSDMYLSETQIRNILQKHKSIKNQIIVSSDGKASCTFWKSNLAKQIILHKGDNYNSDYINPTSNNIRSEWISNVGLTNIESIIESVNKEAAYVLRAIRLSTQHLNNDYYTLFLSLVLPICLLICFYLKDMNTGNKKIIFLSRDGYWFYHVYRLMFPKDDVEYYYFSRLYSQNVSNKHTITEKLSDAIVFDLNGSGKTLSEYTGTCKSITCFTWDPHYTNIQYLMNVSGSAFESFMEDIFSAPHGSVNSNGTLLDPEYDVYKITEYMKCFSEFQTYMNVYKKYGETFSIYNGDDITTKIKALVDSNDVNILTNIKMNFNHVNDHSVPCITYPISYYSQIGQDKYYIEEIIKFKPNGTFLDIGAYDGITGSNTYTLEKLLNWKGLLVECNPDIANRCVSNRTSSVCTKAIYKTSNEFIDFLIPTGHEIDGGIEQLSGIKNFLRSESIHAFENSYKTSKVIQVPTININDLLRSYELSEIDYMSLDVEGYELEILKELDTSTFKIHYLTVEHATVERYKNEIHKVLLSKGYMFVRENRWDSEYKLAH